MANWVLKGLRTGIKTTAYPDRPEKAPGVSPGLPYGARLQDGESAASLIADCPTGAITRQESGIAVDRARCIHCLRCHQHHFDDAAVPWDASYEWGTQGIADAKRKLDNAFGRSLHIRFLDAGACSACISEARQLNNPYYNMHRLGFFMTPTPRQADILLVSGPVSDAMRTPLQKAYEAMPPPKRVVAIGACALFGGVFGPSFAAAAGASSILPVDVMVPGCPPPPLAILHGLLLVVGRKPPAGTKSLPPEPVGECS
jgi:Ni,Fe-hydrogenase III small subunit